MAAKPTTLEAAPTAVGVKVAVQPTQLRRPRRAVVRTVFQMFVGLCAIAPLIVAQTGLDPEQTPWLVAPLAVAAVVTRIMSVPQVESFLRRFAPWLAAAPKPSAPLPAHDDLTDR